MGWVALMEGRGHLMAHYGTRKAVLGTEWHLGTLIGYGS